ncbi:tyrosine-type recombinase/integrase [Sulfurimonas sp.]
MALKPAGGKYEGVWVNELKNGDKSYYINYRDESGSPVKVQVGKKTTTSDFTVKDAYSKLIEVKYKLQHGEEPIFKTGRTVKITLDHIWNEFFIYAQANKKSWAMDKQNYNKHIKPIFGNKDVKSIKALELERFKQTLFLKNLKAQTIKHQLTLIRTMLNYAIKHEIVKNFKSPFENGKVKMPLIDNARQEYLTKEEAKQLLDILKNTHTLTYHLTVILLFTAARFSEITGAASQKNKTRADAPLRWSDVNFNSEEIFLKKTKHGNERYVAMNKILLNTMKELYANKVSENVIVNSNGGIVLRMPKYFMEAIEIVLPGNSKKESKNKITAHSLRHTHASWLAEAGLDILQIKEQLGHKNLEMTMRYSHLIPNIRHAATRELII